MDDKPQRIDKLKQRLYAKKDTLAARHERSGLSKRQITVQHDWEHEHSEDTSAEDGTDETVYTAAGISHVPTGQTMSKKRNKKNWFLRIFLLISVLFFVVALGVAYVVFQDGSTVVSSNNLDITVRGPVSVDGGSILPFEVTVINNNATELKVVDLLIEYPEGTRSSSDVSEELPRVRELLGDMRQGAQDRRQFEAMLFGEEGDVEPIGITVEYRVEGSNAIFSKEKLYEVEIQSAPMTIAVDMPTDINTGQLIQGSVRVTSNATAVIEDVLLVLDAPFGFTLTGATPEPDTAQHTWELGDLEPGGTRRVEIEGVLEGQDTEERIFRFTGGIQSTRDSAEIATPFATKLVAVEIRRPFVSLDVTLNDSRSESYVTNSGQTIHGVVGWRNTLPVELEDAELSVHFEGGALDERTVKVLDGFFDSVTNTITWDRRTRPEFARVDAGQGGEIGFDFGVLDLRTRADVPQPAVTLHVTMTGTPRSAAGSDPFVSTDTTRTVRVASDVLLNTRLVHYAGPFQNTGPIPPQAEQETMYTVIWSVSNSSNGIVDAEMTGVLPPYVRFLGRVSPGSETVTFREDTGQLVWDLGELRSGTGYVTSVREAAFQVGFTPSVIHEGSRPTLIDSIRFKGHDTFADVARTVEGRVITTNFSTDPRFSQGDDRVGE